MCSLNKYQIFPDSKEIPIVEEEEEDEDYDPYEGMSDEEYLEATKPMDDIEPCGTAILLASKKK